MLQIILDGSNRLPYALDKRIYCATCRFCARITSTYEALNVTRSWKTDSQRTAAVDSVHRKRSWICKTESL